MDIYIVQRTFQFSSWKSQKQNCQNECEAKIFLSICECILYHMPRLFDDINICGRANADCIAHVTREIQLKTNNSFICDCLPGCYAISYEAEISMAPLLEQPPLLKKKQMAPRNAALLHVFYKDFYFRSQKKEELIGFTEFLCKFCACISVDWSYYMRYFLRSSLPSYTDSLIPCTINYIKHFSGVNSSDTAYEMMISTGSDIVVNILSSCMSYYFFHNFSNWSKSRYLTHEGKKFSYRFLRVMKRISST